MHEGFIIALLLLSVLPQAAYGLFSRTMVLFAFASRQFAPETMGLSVRGIHSHFVQFSLVNERSGRRPGCVDDESSWRLEVASLHLIKP